ncbi:hypothetical protein ACA910_010411 [Epithemia clementina (nom. ined.)]
MGDLGLTKDEIAYYCAKTVLFENDLSYSDCELVLVGAGLGDGITNTSELQVLTYDEAMKTGDQEKWQEAINEEHDRMVANNVFEIVKLKDFQKGANVIHSTWALKKKASGVYCGRVAARGFKQIEGKSYDPSALFAPVVNEVTIKIVLVLMLMANRVAEVVDVKGAFLLAKFEDEHKVYMKVPKGFEQFYPKELCTIAEENTVRNKAGGKSLLEIPVVYYVNTGI